ncbi:helix-turn-helix transcriptional regulator [Aquipseudomonas alcaligenes]|uniref:helix-turn-helix transcriptional regulator n=1 Tax=Aquipseudomonas alcaligenes TaxID=43263 RepID=UPI00077FF0D2|nr:AlpA family transcriptional regulator [Pseudomonas alcaligenes]AMR67344.1 AlpA family transcriptional regulator [Pseudomonas alcaligenes]
MRLIRLKEVMRATGLARSTIYKYIAEESFPKPVSLGERCVGWVDDEVQDWIMARIEERNVAQMTAVKPGRLSLAC